MFKDIGSFLARFTNISPPDQFLKEELIRVVFEKVGITISKNTIEINGSNAFIQTKSPAIKNEIFIHKSEILKALEGSGSRRIRDIR